MKKLLFLVCWFITGAAFAQNTDNRNVDSFNKIDAGGSINVYLEHGSSNKVRVETRGIDADKVITEVKGDALKIYMEKGNYRNIEAKVYVTYQNLEAINNSGSGNMESESDISTSSFKLNNSGSGNLNMKGSLKADRVSIGMSGSGNVALESVESEDLNLSMSGSADLEINGGYATTVSIDKSGSGDIEADDVKGDNFSISMSGSGNVSITANKTIEGNLSGSGNINYQGNATVTRIRTSGSAEITKN